MTAETTPPEAAFIRMRKAFGRALENSPGELVVRYYRFAGRPTRVRAVGHALADVLDRAWSHLRLDPSPDPTPALSMDFWDEARTGVGTTVTASPFGDASGGGRFMSILRGRTTTAFDRRGGHMISHAPDGAHLGQQERGRPVFEPLTVWHQDAGVLPVHAGLIGRGGHGWLVGGPSGSGKSTTCLRCLEAGFEFVGEDTVGLEEREAGGFRGHGLFGSVQLAPANLDRFPRLAAAREPREPGEPKAMVMLTERFRPALRPQLTIRGLMLPRVTGASHPRLSPASPGEALMRLAPSTLLRRYDVQTGLDRLARLARSVPCHWLDLGDDQEWIPARIEELLS